MVEDLKNLGSLNLVYDKYAEKYSEDYSYINTLA